MLWGSVEGVDGGTLRESMLYVVLRGRPEAYRRVLASPDGSRVAGGEC